MTRDGVWPRNAHRLWAWSGLSVADARAGYGAIDDELLEVEVDGTPTWLPKDREDWLGEASDVGPVTRLLGTFDTYLQGTGPATWTFRQIL